jgi:SET domain-containing protein
MLVIKKSKIPGAGKGLFTTTSIKKGEIVVEYKGKKTTWKECLKKGETGEYSSYVFYVTKNNCVDSEDTLDALGRYANDARGRTRIKGIKNNSEYSVIKGVPYIIATRDIPAKSEVYVSYGDGYWSV